MNLFENVGMVAAEALSVLSDRLNLKGGAFIDHTADFSPLHGFKIGDTIDIKTRPDYGVEEFDGNTVRKQPIRESKRQLTIERHLDVSVELSERDERLFFDGFVEQVARPAAVRIAEKVEEHLGSKLLQAAGLFDGGKVLFADAEQVALAREAAKVQRIGSPMCMQSTALETQLLSQEWFNIASARGQDAEGTLDTGEPGRVMGVEFDSSLYFPETVHTAGDLTAVTSGNQIGDTELAVTDANGIVYEGDRLYIDGMATPLVASGEASGGGIPLRDPITFPIPSGRSVRVAGAGKVLLLRGAFLEPGSFAYAMPRLLPPRGGAVGASMSHEGISIRVVLKYNPETKVTPASLDCLLGSTAWDPRVSMLLAEEFA